MSDRASEAVGRRVSISRAIGERQGFSWAVGRRVRIGPATGDRQEEAERQGLSWAVGRRARIGPATGDPPGTVSVGVSVPEADAGWHGPPWPLARH